MCSSTANRIHLWSHPQADGWQSNSVVMSGVGSAATAMPRPLDKYIYAMYGVLQDHLLPEEYVMTMRQHMLDKCPVSSYAEVRQIIQEDLGAPPEQLFKQFSETPIASASLAQVSQRPILLSIAQEQQQQLQPRLHLCCKC